MLIREPYIQMIGALGIPAALYLAIEVRRNAKRGWYIQKDFRTVVSEFENPRLFAINQRIEKVGAFLCLVIGCYSIWQLVAYILNR